MNAEQLEQERADFEAWWDSSKVVSTPAARHGAWQAWQARAQQQAASAVADEVYCALQYVEGALAAIANREEIVGNFISRVDSIGAASKRAKAALGRLQAVAHLIADPAPTAPADVVADAAEDKQS